MNDNTDFETTPKVNLDAIMNDEIHEMEIHDEVLRQPAHIDGNCIECSDQPAIVFCEQCADGIKYL